MEALRCLKRRLSDVIYRRLLADAQTHDHRHDEASPVGHCGATTQESSAVDLPPLIDTSDQPLPGPAQPIATTADTTPEDLENHDPSTHPLTQTGARSGRMSWRRRCQVTRSSGPPRG